MKISRVEALSEKDKLWELYLHTLAGWHGNTVANKHNSEKISELALSAAREALTVWNKHN